MLVSAVRNEPPESSGWCHRSLIHLSPLGTELCDVREREGDRSHLALFSLVSVCRCCLFFSSFCSASVWFPFTNGVIPVLFKTQPYYCVLSPPPPLHTALFVWIALSHQCVKYAVKNSTQTHWQFIPSWLWLPCGKWSESLWSSAALLFHRPTQWVFLWLRAGAGSRGRGHLGSKQSCRKMPGWPHWSKQLNAWTHHPTTHKIAVDYGML